MAQTILVVDDMSMYYEPIEAILRAEGYRTAVATNGKDALIAVTAARPDLVLLDMGMPGMDGLEVLKQMRDRPHLRETPVIILSAESDRSRITEAAQLGISGYLLKTNFSLKDLLKRVRSQLAIPEPTPRGLGGSSASHLGQPRTPAMDEPKVHATSETNGHTSAMVSGPKSSIALEVPYAGEQAVDPDTLVKSLKPILTRSDLLQRLKSRDELKGFSPTVSQVLKLMASPSCSLDAVSNALRLDHAMALKILKIANSSVYSRGDRVDTVHKAILRIGTDCIRQLVLNIGVVERFGSLALGELLSIPQFWEHSIACGIIAAELAHSQDAKGADSAFTSGLLHDLGRIVFAEVLEEQYVRVIETARRLAVPLELVEARMLLLNHADVMDRLLSAWQFPKHLIDPIRLHHLSVDNARRAAPTRLPEILRLSLADRLAHAMLLGDSGNETIYPTEEHCRALGISASAISSIESIARQQTDDTKLALLSSSNGHMWPRRSEQVRASLQSAFRPMYFSAQPALDAYRIFCGVLTDPGDDEPLNIVVVHIASVGEKETLAKQLADSEMFREASGLPVLVLSPGGKLLLDDCIVSGRRHRVLGTPTSVRQFIEAVNGLVSENSARSAA